MSCIYLHLMDVGAAEPLARKMGGERVGRLLASVVRSVCRWAGGHEGQMEQNSLGNSVYLITASRLPPSLPGDGKKALPEERGGRRMRTIRS